MVSNYSVTTKLIWLTLRKNNNKQTHALKMDIRGDGDEVRYNVTELDCSEMHPKEFYTYFIV